jgi:tetratricopeptide (TPR) repeat protein
MDRLKRGAVAIAAVVAASFFALASCAHPMKSVSAPVVPVPSAPAERKPAPEATKTFRPEAAIKEADQHVARGEFEEAMNSVIEAIDKYPAETKLAAYYPELMESVRAGAEKLFEGQNYDAAGRAYRLLLDHYPEQGKGRQPSFSREFLNARIEMCARKLTDTGLVKYRAGELDGAISVWAGILKFDPSNEPVKKAISTARTQLKSLSAE